MIRVAGTGGMGGVWTGLGRGDVVSGLVVNDASSDMGGRLTLYCPRKNNSGCDKC